ncbi:hypothetical protein [Vibrio sp. WXL103]|uniref:hypothetical protein n=1 Tax=Vibrio sp. WXL103 TaxID=3450710 RepID=UPI003EC67D50
MRTHTVLPMAAFALLVGCQQEGAQSEPPAVSAMSYVTAVPGGVGYVDVSGQVRHGEALSTVTSSSCEHAGVDGLGFYVEQAGSLCDYAFTASGPGGRASAVAWVADADELVMLPPIGVALERGDDMYLVMMPTGDEHGVDISDYLLQDTFIVEGLPVTARANTGRIVLESDAIDRIGYSSVYYQLSHPNAGSDARPAQYLGVVDVTFSEPGSHPPVAGPGRHPNMVNVGDTVSIAIDPWVTAGSHAYELVNVTAMGASVRLDDDNPNQFLFSALTAGEHVVRYTVSDHRAGVSSHLVRVTAVLPEGEARWDDIFHQGYSFTAPMTYSMAQREGLLPTAVYEPDYTPEVYMAAMAYDDVAYYCQQQGFSMPDAAAAQVLIHADPVSKNWPAGSAYWLEGGESVFSLADGSLSPADASHYYATCAQSLPLTLSVESNTLIANNQPSSSVEVRVMPAQATTVSLKLTEGAAVLNGCSGSSTQCTVNTDDTGVAHVTLQGTKAGSVLLEASLNELKAEQRFTLLADPDTGIATLKVIRDSQPLWTGYNQLQLNLNDAYDNPLEGVDFGIPGLGGPEPAYGQVHIDADTTQIMNKSGKMRTDDKGQLVISLRDYDNAAHDTSVWVTYQRPDGSEYESIKREVSFTELSYWLLDVEAIVPIGRAMLALRDRGLGYRVVAWGADVPTPSGNLAQELATLQPEALFYTQFAAAAVVDDEDTNRLIAWGDVNAGGTLTEQAQQTQDIVTVNASERAFAALTRQGDVVTWGSKWYGGDVSMTDIDQPVTAIVGNQYAFVAEQRDGRLKAWGEPDFGGTIPDGLTGHAQDIIGNYRAFSMITEQGTVVSWGEESHGGDGPPDPEQRVTHLAATRGADSSSGGAFAAITEGGDIMVWGHRNYGGRPPVVTESVIDIVSNYYAFAALTVNGNVITWGGSSYGGTVPDNVVSELRGITHIETLPGGFAAWRDDGAVVIWGLYSNSTDPSPKVFTNATQVAGSLYGYAVLHGEGSVTGFGHSTLAQWPFEWVQAQLIGVRTLYANDYGFAAQREDGSVVTWGHSWSNTCVRQPPWLSGMSAYETYGDTLGC